MFHAVRHSKKPTTKKGIVWKEGNGKKKVIRGTSTVFYCSISLKRSSPEIT